MMTWVKLGWIGCLVGWASVALGADAPIQRAAQARLQLKPLEGSELFDGFAVNLDGSWMDPGEAKDAGRDVSFPIDVWRWCEATIRFTPREDGRVELHLSGPWEEAEPGVVWRQEVLWDDVSAEGTDLVNGDFSKGVEGWTSPWSAYPEKNDWPLEGEARGASWLGRPLVQELELKKDRPVVLHFEAMAALPKGERKMVRMDEPTPAHAVAEKLVRGVNLGNCWEAPVDSWGVTFGVEDIDRIADAGFDHIRVPVGWHHRWEDGEISPKLLDALEPVMRRALQRGLWVMLDWHGYAELTAEPDKHEGAFVEGWEKISRHFRDWPKELMFELLNEPAERLQGERLNRLYEKTLKVVRAENPGRMVVLDPGRWASADELGQLWIPEDEKRVMVSFHAYDPFPFTHQQASWVHYEDVREVRFPGPPRDARSAPSSHPELQAWFRDYSDPTVEPNPSSLATVTRLLEKAREWSQVFGRPVHLGEFGCVRQADPESRSRYARGVRSAAEERKIPWCWWEWKVGFGVVDLETWKPYLLDELTGE
ncbi:hypothetical protein HNR46_001678 [Haloferula luteola]|uniref:Glycoside hydrolase family 5 domain-containing protein n=1 Tax=Haloferula luteola TaxID=595692 RepID=A0A840V0A7_9BACT|nr:glycoside hydrolase family 5 protein [Haloferula luteola]MBB5351442.1 hypothetical protein [Haloferula luteola]